MEKATREFIKMAYLAMQQAYWFECTKGDENTFLTKENEETKEIGKVLQAVGDLSRKL